MLGAGRCELEANDWKLGTWGWTRLYQTTPDQTTLQPDHTATRPHSNQTTQQPDHTAPHHTTPHHTTSHHTTPT